MRQRYYNTEIKRFINQDIVVGSISNSQSLNRYSYVQGNPVTLTDPFGLSPSAKDIIMGAIHGILDVVGCSPEGIGIAANLLNAALYAFVDHDYGMASLSLLAGVTLGATKVVAMGGKIAKAAKTVETVGKFVSNVASFAICASQAVDVGSAMWQKYYVEGKSLDGDSAMEFLALGLNMAGMAVSGKGMVESGNKICKSIKESGVTNKISGKVKPGAKIAWNSNRGTSVGDSKSSSNSLGIVNGKTPASRLADKLRGLSNSKRPNTVAVVRTADGKYYVGYNKAGIYNNNIQKVLDYLGNKNIYNRQCAEVNAISRAFNDRADLRGATISVANVKKASDVSGVHGTFKPPCDVCQPLIDFFGIEVIK